MNILGNDSSLPNSVEHSTEIQKKKDLRDQSFLVRIILRPLLLITLFIIKIFGDAGVSLYFPEYPTLAESKGVSSAEVGLVLGLYPFISFLIFPAVGYIMMFADKKVTIVANGFLAFGVLSLYGFIEVMDRLTFEIYSLLFPILIGISQSFITIAIFMILWGLLPNNRTFLVAISAGYFLGPAIGGVLSDSIGFLYMYFLISSIGLCFIFVVIILFSITPINITEPKKGRRTKLPILVILSRPIIVAQILILFFTSFFYTFNLPILGPYLRERYDVGSSTIGFIMMVSEVVYIVTSIIIGLLIDGGYCIYLKTLSSLGISVLGIGLFFYPPSSLVFPEKGDLLHFTYIGSILVGIGGAVGVIPTSVFAIEQAVECLPDEDGLEGLVEGLLQGAWYLGEALGPLAGGVLIEWYSFDTLFSGVSLSAILVSIFLVTFVVWDKITQLFLRITGHVIDEDIYVKRC